jgi:hypothetical protein
LDVTFDADVFEELTRMEAGDFGSGRVIDVERIEENAVVGVESKTGGSGSSPALFKASRGLHVKF